jgi:hypothetical protein
MQRSSVDRELRGPLSVNPKHFVHEPGDVDLQVESILDRLPGRIQPRIFGANKEGHSAIGGEGSRAIRWNADLELLGSPGDAKRSHGQRVDAAAP